MVSFAGGNLQDMYYERYLTLGGNVLIGLVTFY